MQNILGHMLEGGSYPDALGTRKPYPECWRGLIRHDEEAWQDEDEVDMICRKLYKHLKVQGRIP